ncbi:MAG TPA: FAD-dependent oxidoreductase [bacterium]|nr:FAD-dependent oxidoreductase [bacterium]
MEDKIMESPDVLVVGGGIVGTAIYRECAKNGMDVQLVERGDFGGDISAGSTEMAHGGFRYLMALSDWPLVFESLTERELLSINAKHLVKHLNFYMPVYRGDGTTFDFCIPFIPKWPIKIGKYFGLGMLMMQAGMILYKLFAVIGLLFKGFKPNNEEIGYKKYKKDEMLKIGPELNEQDLVGGFRFTDCKIEDVERLVIENVISAEKYAAAKKNRIHAANYTEAVDFERGSDGKITSVTVKDRITGETQVIKPKILVNSTGIFIDEVLKKTKMNGPRDLVRRVSGIHLIVPRFWKSSDLSEAYAFWIDQKILFAISKGEGRILVGTTERDIDIEEGINHNRTFKADIEEVARKFKSRFPAYNYNPETDIHYTRVRPLEFQPTMTDPKAASRHDLIHWHKESPNMVSVSGKLGPARHLAEIIARGVFNKLGKSGAFTPTFKDRFPGGEIEGTLKEYTDAQRNKHGDIDPKMISNLINRYGSRYEEVLEYAGGPEDLVPVGGAPAAVPICAIVFAFEKEHCRKMSDALTRTGNTKFFGEGLDCIEKAAAYAGSKLGWDEARVKSEIDDYREFIKQRREVVE